MAASAYGGGKRLFRLEFSHIDSKYNYLLFVSQAETEKVLREALDKAGVKIEWGVTMTAFAEPEHSATLNAVIENQDGTVEQVKCSYLISAEGAHSTTRQTLDLPFEGKSAGRAICIGRLLH